MSKRFRDEDMLAHKGGGDSHVAKRKQRNKALEIVFDPKSHKEYITGFRKRKQQRRKDALTSLEKKQRQQRIEERADRRQALKEQLHLERYETDSDAEVEGEVKGGAEPKVQVYNAGGMTSTVIVAPIKVHSDSEDEEEEELEEMPAAATALKLQIKKQKRKAMEDVEREEEAGAGAGHRTKLSKTALRIMSKTKAKIEGKKTVGRKAAGLGSGLQRGGGKGGGKGKKGRR